MVSRLMFAVSVAALPAMIMAQEAARPAEEEKAVTRMELSAELDKDYADLDADSDGKVTPAEINTRLVKSAEAQVELLKKERDAAFARLDTNGDGSISRAEFDERAKLPTIKEPDAKPFLDRFDANKDEAISKDEFRTPTLANFDKLDKDKNGTLTPAERKAAVAAATKKPAPKQTPPIGR